MKIRFRILFFGVWLIYFLVSPQTVLAREDIDRVLDKVEQPGKDSADPLGHLDWLESSESSGEKETTEEEYRRKYDEYRKQGGHHSYDDWLGMFKYFEEREKKKKEEAAPEDLKEGKDAKGEEKGKDEGKKGEGKDKDKKPGGEVPEGSGGGEKPGFDGVDDLIAVRYADILEHLDELEREGTISREEKEKLIEDFKKGLSPERREKLDRRINSEWLDFLEYLIEWNVWFGENVRERDENKKKEEAGKTGEDEFEEFDYDDQPKFSESIQ